MVWRSAKRMIGCPPRAGVDPTIPRNSTANASFLMQLRYLLVQDFDFSDDGKPDTLRLCFATPRRWLEDGKQVKVERAPTAFGPVSVSLTSHLARGEVLATVQLPQRNRPDKVLLRARVRYFDPEGQRPGLPPDVAALALHRAGQLFLNAKRRSDAREAFQTAAAIEGVKSPEAKQRVADAARQAKKLGGTAAGRRSPRR